MFPYICIYFIWTHIEMCGIIQVRWRRLVNIAATPTFLANGGRLQMAEKKVSAAQRKATDKYLEKFDEMRVRVPSGQKALIKAHADSRGESLNSFIIRAMTETMERDAAATRSE